MRIALLTTSQNKEKIEDLKLIKAAEKRGHSIQRLNVLDCCLSISTKGSTIYYDDKRIGDDFDVVIPRIDMPHVDYGLTILHQFLAVGTHVTDQAGAIAAGHNKIQCLQKFVEAGLPFPTTGYAHSTEDFDQILETVGGVPLIAKLLKGTEGIGVFLADDMKHAQNILKTFKQLDAPVLVQSFVKESSGIDIRAFVVDGKIVAAMRRESSDEDFRANVSLGGTSYQATLSDEEKNLVLKSTKALDINVAGVDFIRSETGPLLIEINSSPDFSGPNGLDEVTGIDVAGAIIEYAVSSIPKVQNTRAA